ncbi:MAG: methyltransferase domain-containing protein [Ferruginibacter sp.]|nr:methyltransferase domain-containing protein [Cytophagales bacterium]
MDELTLGNEDLRRNLEELAFINHWLGGNKLTINGLEQILARYPAPHPAGWRIADLGCGGGDMLALMARWARRKNIGASLVGIDANGFTLAYAKEHTAAYSSITYLQQNVFSEAFKQHTFDVVTCTLFCHHFDAGHLVDLLRQLRGQTRVGIILNDLHRHWLAYYSIAWLTRWFSRSYLVKNDAKLSVWRAFHRHELTQVITDAGFTDFQIRWRWAFRWEVVIFV